MRLEEIVRTSSRVADTAARLEKRAHLVELLRAVPPAEVETVVGFLTGEPRQGRIGVGYAALRDLEVPAAVDSSLTVAEVDRALTDIAAIEGAGSGRRRQAALGALFGRATAAEQRFLGHLLVGELRQGALEGVMVDAVAKAADVPLKSVRRAHMLSGDLGGTARLALTEGRAALDAVSIRLFNPVKPMLAGTADGVAEALEVAGEAAFEHKLDGARVQVHKAGDEVRVFTRKLNEVTAAVPEVVELARALPARTAILDGETLALRKDGRPHRFQDTMRRFGRTRNVDALRGELPLSVFFFDCLLLDDQSLLKQPGVERFAALERTVADAHRIPRLVTADADAADAFLRASLAAGHEGVMAKALDAPYDAGKRGKKWLKVKPVHVLDLVVLAAEWGSGRRRGKLSNLHLGARDEANGGFVMLGKTFKGLTDALLAWQTKALLERQIGREGHIVHVRPELVVEIAFDGVQTSPRYPGGLALRFARVKRYRPDKQAAEADTFAAVQAIHRAGA